MTRPVLEKKIGQQNVSQFLLFEGRISGFLQKKRIADKWRKN